MKKVFLLVSTGVLFTILGCSGNSQKAAPAVVQASAAPATSSIKTTSSIKESEVALPVPSLGKSNPQVWRPEEVKDYLGNAIALTGTSMDGKFDLVILERGTYSFLSLVKHDRWNLVYNHPGKGKLMYLRVKFDDGQEKRIEWDELGFATDNLCSVLWSYPADSDAPSGPAPEGPTAAAVGGDQVLLQDMIKHQTMLLEVEPGVTTQFNLAGLAHQIEKTHAPKTQPVIEARQTTE